MLFLNWDTEPHLPLPRLFHGETGEGLGASHQTGWTALVVRLVRERREKLLESEFASAKA